MTPSLPTTSVLEAIRVIDALLAAPIGQPDAILRMRAINAVEDLRGQLLAALPDQFPLRDAA